MLYRTLGSTGVSVSVIELGTWQPGGEWGRTFNPGRVRAIFNAVRESVEAPWLKRDTLEDLRVFYDSALIDIHKAPSLGSDETLPCPYTLLTHYTSSGEELADIGLPRFLLRIAVGCERDIGLLIESLDEALSASVHGGVVPATSCPAA